MFKRKTVEKPRETKRGIPEDEEEILKVFSVIANDIEEEYSKLDQLYAHREPQKIEEKTDFSECIWDENEIVCRGGITFEDNIVYSPIMPKDRDTLYTDEGMLIGWMPDSNYGIGSTRTGKDSISKTLTIDDAMRLAGLTTRQMLVVLPIIDKIKKNLLNTRRMLFRDYYALSLALKYLLYSSSTPKEIIDANWSNILLVFNQYKRLDKEKFYDIFVNKYLPLVVSVLPRDDRPKYVIRIAGDIIKDRLQNIVIPSKIRHKIDRVFQAVYRHLDELSELPLKTISDGEEFYAILMLVADVPKYLIEMLGLNTSEKSLDMIRELKKKGLLKLIVDKINP